MRNKKILMLLPRLKLTASFSILLPPSLRAVQGNREWRLWSFHSHYLCHPFILFCCSVSGPSFMNCSSVGPSEMDCSSVSSHMGLRSCQKTCSSMGCPQAEASFRACPPAEVWGPPWLQVDVCSTADSMSWRVAPVVICLGYRRLLSCFPSSYPDPGVCRAVAPPFFLTSCSRSCCVPFLPFPKHCQRDAISLSVLAQLCLGSSCSRLGHRCSSSFFLTQPTPA